jgi:hypothetical protein
MAVLTTHRHRGSQPTITIVMRAAIVGLTLATAAIHATLGGTLFLMNAVGYTALALALVLPGPLGRIRWLTRWALIGFTAVTVGGWLMFGARFDLAYLDKGIEVALIGLLLLESWMVDGGPLGAVRRARRIAGSILG